MEKFAIHAVVLSVLVTVFYTACARDLGGDRSIFDGSYKLDKLQSPECNFPNQTAVAGHFPELQSYINCSLFYECAPSASNPGSTYPVQKVCAPGHDGNPIYYDFRACECTEDKTRCFNAAEDADELYSCVWLYVPTFNDPPSTT